MTELQLNRATPESLGISSTAVLNWLAAVEENVHDLHSFMLLRHGQVAAEGWWQPYQRSDPHMLFSLSKSFTSTAVGMAIAEGLFNLDDTVISFFPDDLPAWVSPNLQAMQVRHLLGMCTGHDEDTTGYMRQAKDGNWAKAFLLLPVVHAPGTHFLYNTGATYMLSAIVQKTSGQKLIDFLTPRLFNKLGIENPTWEEDPRGINTGGFGLNVRTEDIARFGQMYLQEGMWNGEQLLSPEWVKTATSAQIDNSPNPNPDWEQGYGYQFWRCRHNAYRGDGAFGQYCIVMPEQDVVLAITAGLADMQTPLNLVWDILLPAMSLDALPADPSAQQTLTDKLNGLFLNPPAGELSSPTEQRVSARTYQLKSNPIDLTSLCVEFSEQGALLTASDPRGTHTLDLGRGAWRMGETSLFARAGKSAASGVWTAPDVYTITVRMLETTFTHTLSLDFSGSGIKIRGGMNVSFGPTELPEIEGW